jgi:hydrogenase-4 component B
MAGRSLNRPDWIWLGLAGCLLHVWNHALFKALLFLSAGSVIHAVRTRTIDRLGGLAKCMPWTAGLFLIGAVAICGLPPLNGFVSELLIYLGLLRGVSLGGSRAGMLAAAGAPVLALIGALAVACFVKVYGAVFLGSARSADA